MTSPAPLRGPQGGDPAKVREAIVKDAGEAAARQTKAHFTTALTATEKRLIEAITETQARDAFDKGKAAGLEIGRAEGRFHGWRAALLGGIGGLGLGLVIGWLALNGVSEQQARTVTEAVAQGVILDDVKDRAADDNGHARGREPASAP